MKRALGSMIIVIFLWLALVYGNFEITRLTLLRFLIGDALLATIFALVFAGIDIAGLFRIVTPETDARKEDVLVWMLFGVFLVASMFNAGLVSVFWLETLSVYQGVPELQNVYNIFPYIFSFGTLVIRWGIVIALGHLGDRALQTRVFTGRRHQPRPQQQQQRPKPRPQPEPPKPRFGPSDVIAGVAKVGKVQQHDKNRRNRQGNRGRKNKQHGG